MNANELDAAIERLRRVKAGEDPVEVYRTATRFGRVTLNNEWTIHDAHGLAGTMMAEDHETLADAYLELGTRQPDEQRVYANGILQDAEDVYDLIYRQGAKVKIERVATFIQEIPEVPNAD